LVALFGTYLWLFSTKVQHQSSCMFRNPVVLSRFDSVSLKGFLPFPNCFSGMLALCMTMQALKKLEAIRARRAQQQQQQAKGAMPSPNGDKIADGEQGCADGDGASSSAAANLTPRQRKKLKAKAKTQRRKQRRQEAQAQSSGAETSVPEGRNGGHIAAGGDAQAAAPLGARSGGPHAKLDKRRGAGSSKLQAASAKAHGLQQPQLVPGSDKPLKGRRAGAAERVRAETLGKRQREDAELDRMANAALEAMGEWLCALGCHVLQRIERSDAVGCNDRAQRVDLCLAMHTFIDTGGKRGRRSFCLDMRDDICHNMQLQVAKTARQSADGGLAAIKWTGWTGWLLPTPLV
jgi:hypothetical protein